MFDRGGIDGVPDGANPSIDADPGADSPVVDAANAPGHLLLTEVLPRKNNHEFIEIFNPTDSRVDLSNYYLSDDQDYWMYPATRGTGPTPTIGTSDFIVKFPDGAGIEPGEVMVIAMRFATFVSAFPGVTPNYAIEDVRPEQQMVDLGYTVGAPTIVDAGEGVVLFYWDQVSDLVRDVDMVTAGHNPAPENRLADKTGRMVDGPDGDLQSSQYAADSPVIADLEFNVPTTSYFSYQRRLLEDGYERRRGDGNGLFGDDETSEEMRVTWPLPFGIATPGQVDPALRVRAP